MEAAARVEAGYNSPSRVRDSELASDETSQTGEATVGFVPRPAILPRPRRGTSQPTGNHGGRPGYRWAAKVQLLEWTLYLALRRQA